MVTREQFAIFCCHPLPHRTLLPPQGTSPALEAAARGFRNVRMLVHSNVPWGRGVSSSAAIEVPTLAALSAAFQVHVRHVAPICTLVENILVGAPCGAMDQAVVWKGRRDCLLCLLC